MIDVVCDQAMVDEVAKEIFIKRVFSIKGMKDYELREVAQDAFLKAKIFIEIRTAMQSGGK